MLIEYCYHTHTYRCGHAEGDVEDYVKEAIKYGIKRLGFSDHVMVPGISQPGIRGEYEQAEDYFNKVKEAKEKYKDQIEILLGFECEYAKQVKPYYEHLLHDGIVDYLIIGQHGYMDKKMNLNFYSPDKTRKGKKRLQRYGKDVINGMKTGLFKYVAHPDVLVFYYKHWDSLCEKITKKICKASLKYDVPLEINLLPSRKYPLKEIDGIQTYGYPYEKFWKIVDEYKCKVVFGFDAHSPAHFKETNLEYFDKFISNLNLNIIKDYKL